MQIIVHPGDQLRLVTEYMDFNSIPYAQVDLYDANESLIKVPTSVDDTLVIMDFIHFNDFAECDISYKSFLDYTSNPSNKLWIFGSHDFLRSMMEHQSSIEKLDALVKHRNVTFYFEAPPTEDCFLKKLKNIQVDVLPYNWHMHFPRIERAISTKTNCKNNFLLTTIGYNNSRPHREMLWKRLTAKPHLLDNSIAIYHNTKINDGWLGSVSTSHSWNDGHPSMNLYNDCWFEIVPETLYRFGNFITEKTIKPIATKTPFLVVSTPGYLKFLRSYGFQTFHSVIDEKYDTILNLEDRVNAIVDQVENIIQNGAKNFYQSTLDITTHNQNRLLELSGRYQFDIDIFLEKQFSSLGI